MRNEIIRAIHNVGTAVDDGLGGTYYEVDADSLADEILKVLGKD